MSFRYKRKSGGAREPAFPELQESGSPRRVQGCNKHQVRSGGSAGTQIRLYDPTQTSFYSNKRPVEHTVALQCVSELQRMLNEAVHVNEEARKRKQHRNDAWQNGSNKKPAYDSDERMLEFVEQACVRFLEEKSELDRQKGVRHVRTAGLSPGLSGSVTSTRFSLGHPQSAAAFTEGGVPPTLSASMLSPRYGSNPQPPAVLLDAGMSACRSGSMTSPRFSLNPSLNTQPSALQSAVIDWASRPAAAESATPGFSLRSNGLNGAPAYPAHLMPGRSQSEEGAANGSVSSSLEEEVLAGNFLGGIEDLDGLESGAGFPSTDFAFQSMSQAAMGFGNSFQDHAHTQTRQMSVPLNQAVMGFGNSFQDHVHSQPRQMSVPFDHLDIQLPAHSPCRVPQPGDPDYPGFIHEMNERARVFL